MLQVQSDRDPALPLPVAERAGWGALDVRAVDTTRLLAADAVQKVGNGHPGTAMSLAPLAYLLFQRVMRHDPADDQWLGRDRFVLSCGHSSLTLYVQLYLSGYGLELADASIGDAAGTPRPGGVQQAATPPPAAPVTGPRDRPAPRMPGPAPVGRLVSRGAGAASGCPGPLAAPGLEGAAMPRSRRQRIWSPGTDPVG
ncbi:hypothetical protein GCM10027610_040040 [Dactylosporangium cerinum]